MEGLLALAYCLRGCGPRCPPARGGGGGGCLIKSVIQAAAEADVRAHVRQTPSYSNVPEQNGKEGCRAWEGQTPRRRSDVD